MLTLMDKLTDIGLLTETLYTNSQYALKQIVEDTETNLFDGQDALFSVCDSWEEFCDLSCSSAMKNVIDNNGHICDEQDDDLGCMLCGVRYREMYLHILRIYDDGQQFLQTLYALCTMHDRIDQKAIDFAVHAMQNGVWDRTELTD